MHLHVAIGVHTGDMTVTSRKKKLRYVARGDTTRLARRLSTLADHGEILVSERVSETAEVHFSLTTGPLLRSRGDKPDTPSFSLNGRRHGLRVAGNGPWLRRGNELEVIRNKIVELSKNMGGLVWLTGEVGTGKSRLLKELRGISGKRKVPLYSGVCSPSSEHPALDPFRDVLTDILHIETETVDDDFDSALQFLGHVGLTQKKLMHSEVCYCGNRETKIYKWPCGVPSNTYLKDCPLSIPSLLLLKIHITYPVDISTL